MDCFCGATIRLVTLLALTSPSWAKGDMVLVEIMGGHLPSTIKITDPKIEDFNIWAGQGVNGVSFFGLCDILVLPGDTVVVWERVRRRLYRFPVNGKVVPDADVDLVGAYVVRDIPKGSLVLLAEERPGDYWYVMPITIALVVIALVFSWVLVRSVRRDLLPPR